MRSEDNACVQIWKWDLTLNKRGPISVETQWKQWIIDEWENKERFSKQKINYATTKTCTTEGVFR